MQFVTINPVGEQWSQLAKTSVWRIHNQRKNGLRKSHRTIVFLRKQSSLTGSQYVCAYLPHYILKHFTNFHETEQPYGITVCLCVFTSLYFKTFH